MKNILTFIIITLWMVSATAQQFSAGPDKAICIGGTTTLEGTGPPPPTYTYEWTSVPYDPTISNPTILTPTVTPTQTTVYTLTGRSVDPINLVVNGDFESGNTYFTSLYIHSPGYNGLYPEGTYAITDNANYNHNQWFCNNDHTTGSGNFMAINGAQQTNVVIWSETITVSPNTEYEFSTWVSSLSGTNPAILQFSINGILLGNVFNASSTTCVWNKFFEIWNSGTSTTAIISIVNQNTAGGGNDFSLDDIHFSFVTYYDDDCAVTVTPLPTSTFNMATQICANETVTITYTGNAPATAQYNWDFDGATIVNGSGQGPYEVYWNNTGTHTVQLWVEDACVSGTTSNNINVLLAPTSTFDLPSQTCANETITITYTGTALPTAQYNWDFDGATIVSGSGQGPYQVYWNNPGVHIVQLWVEDACVSETTSNNIDVLLSPTSTFNLPSQTCSNETITITYTGNAPTTAQYNWDFDGATIVSGSGQGPYQVYWNNTGVHTVQLWVEDACVSETTSNNIDVLLSPTSTFILPSQTCSNETITITYSGNAPTTAQYNWNFDGATIVSGSGQGPYVVYWNNTGTHTVQLEVDNGCSSGITSHDIISDLSPSSTLTADATSIPYGTSTTLHAVMNGSPGPLDFEWQPEDSLQNATILNPETILLEATTQYFFNIIDQSSNCTSTDSIIIQVTGGALDILSLTATPNTICQGETSTLLITITGGSGNYEITWTSDPPGFNYTGSELSIDVTPNETTTYFAEVFDQFTTVYSSIQVTVNQNPSSTLTADATTIPFGTSTILHAVMNGSPGPLDFEWQPENSLQNATILDPETILLEATTEYFFDIIDQSSGCTSSDSITIVVTGGILEILSLTAMPDSICLGETSTLLIDITGGSGDYETTWTSDPPGFNYTGSEFSIDVTPSETTTYTAEVFDQFTTTTSSIQVTVNQNPSSTLTADATTIPLGTSTILHAVMNGSPGPLDFEWQPEDSLQDATILDPETILLSTTTKYFFNIIDQSSNCTSTDSIIIQVTGGLLNILSLTATPDSVCEGQPTTLLIDITGGSGNYEITWTSDPPGLNYTGPELSIDVIPDTNTIYFAEVFDQFTYVSSSIGIILLPYTIIVSQPQNLLLLAGEMAEFNVSADFADSYQWQESSNEGSTWNELTNGNEYSGVNSSSLLIDPVNSNMNGNLYRCIVTGLCNDVPSEEATLNVYELHNFISSLSQANYCIGDTFSIPCNVSNFIQITEFNLSIEYNNSILDYVGLTNITPELSNNLHEQISGNNITTSWDSIQDLTLTDGVLFYFTFTALSEGATVINWNQQLCNATNLSGFHPTMLLTDGNIEIFAFPEPPNSVFSDNDTIWIIDNIDITLTAIGGYGDELVWSLNNCDSTRIGTGTPFTILRPEETSIYYAYWQNLCGISQCAEVLIVINTDFNIAIPNAFTPNGDGLNDEFGIVSNIILKEFDMQIYNRWGQLIFETNDQTNRWDGTYNGNKANSGTYIWKLIYNLNTTGPYNKKEVETGTVVLID